MATIERATPILVAGRIMSMPGLRVLRLGNLLPAVIWLCTLKRQLSLSDFPPTLGSSLLLLLTAWTVVLFMMRREARDPMNARDMTLGLAGTIFLALLPRAGAGNDLSNSVQIIGSTLGVAALAGLGRSFGVAPADRGLQQGGIYSIIRHPLYASELIFFSGFFLTRPSLYAGAIIATWWLIQVLRMYREERVIDGYAAYKNRVRWRVIPLVW